MSGPKPKPFECPEPVFWYLVGLIASDGCLSRDGRHVDITAKEKEFLTQVRRAAQLNSRVTRRTTESAYRIQIGSRSLYDRLTAVGLTPAKSLTIGQLKVPDTGFADFLRGVIDGDGSIRRWIHPTNGREQWIVKIVSASRPFLAWLQEAARRLWSVEGRIHERPPMTEKHHILYTMKFGKIAAKIILAKCYYPGALALDRKASLASECVSIRVGWSKSKTARDPGYWKNWTYWRSNLRLTHGEAIDPTAGIVSDGFAEFFAGVAERNSRVT